MNQSVRPQVQFAEPRDASFAQDLAVQGITSTSTITDSDGLDYSYEAIGLLVMGVGLFALALTIVIARSIKSK